MKHNRYTKKSVINQSFQNKLSSYKPAQQFLTIYEAKF